MIWATVSSWSCFCWLYRAFPSLAAKKIINLIFVSTIWWCPYVESSLLLLEEGFAVTSAFSWQNSNSLCPASFCPPWPFCLLLQVILDFLFFHSLYVSVSSVQSLSCVRLFVTPWITAHQASLFFTNSQSLLKLMPIESVMPSSHLILCRPLLLLPPIPPSIRVFSNESTLHEAAKVLEFQLQHQSC